MKIGMFLSGLVRIFSAIFHGFSSNSILPPDWETDPRFGISVKNRAEPAGQIVFGKTLVDKFEGFFLSAELGFLQHVSLNLHCQP